MRLRRIKSAVFAAGIAFSPSVPQSTLAADPASGAVGAANPSVSWTGPDVSAETSGPEACQEQSGALFPPFCDDFSLSVTDQGELNVFVTGTVPANDFDLYVYDNTGALVGSSAAPAGLEATSIACATPAAGPYVVRTSAPRRAVPKHARSREARSSRPSVMISACQSPIKAS